MSVRIDWNELDKLPGSKQKCFEEFCFHIARRLFGPYGTVSYFYNTPGSEFYVELNTSKEHAGIDYKAGDVIGWQCKYWRGTHDDDNSPLGSAHINELFKGFKTSIRRQPNIKLWIICTPGSFVEDQWDKLQSKLREVKEDCSFESWHRSVFHSIYLEDVSFLNGVFFYYFGYHLGKRRLDEITKDTLEILNNKFDVDLHTPTSFEDSLLTIVDETKAKELLLNRLEAYVNRVEKDRERPILYEDGWNYPLLSEDFKNAYSEDLLAHYAICEQLKVFQNDEQVLKKAGIIFYLIDEYQKKREERVDLLNKEIQALSDKNRDAGSLDYYISEMVRRINDLEEYLTSNHEDTNNSILSVVNWVITKDFSVFAEAGHGKTHFACSIATNMLQNELPALLLTGSMFRNCDDCSSKLVTMLEMPVGSTIDEVIDVLDYLGELYKCRIPVIIDGLNETAPNENRWRIELPPLRRKIRGKRNIVLITTCREKEEYVYAIYGCKNYKDTENPILLPGIESKNLQQTVGRYFKKYNIRPNTLNAHTIFTDPLLLKVFCVTNKNRADFEITDHTLATCMKDYSDQLVTGIATEDGKHNRLLHHQLEEGLRNVSRMIWEGNVRSVDYYSVFADTFKEKTEDFLNEGMCFMIDNVDGTERIQFSYDLLGGYHIAKAIVDDHKDKESFCQYISQAYSCLFGEGRHPLAEDTIKSLFYLVPSRYGQEWFELMDRKEIIVAAMDHLDIIAFEEKGREAFARMIALCGDDSETKERLCKRLFERVYHQANLLHISMFLPFFNGMSMRELDSYWNSCFSGYDLLAQVRGLLHDKYLIKRYAWEDRAVLSLLLCGIVDREFREYFISELFELVSLDKEKGLELCRVATDNKDPFVFEAVVSVVVGSGLRSKDKSVINKCVSILTRKLDSIDSNPVFLLDGLETLFSYGEQQLGMSFDRGCLFKNKDEKWPVTSPGESRLFSLFEYEFDKLYIRPLTEGRWNREPIVKQDEVYGMLFGRATNYGYDEDAYRIIQQKENKKVSYRQNLRTGYGEKVGRYVVLEFYGWLMVNGRLKGEYKGTFRSGLLIIDASFPRIITKRTLVSNSLMVNESINLHKWCEDSDIDSIGQLFNTELPKLRGDWILLRGYFEQRVDEKYSSIFLSGFSELVPADANEIEISKDKVHDENDYYHAFLGEMGWRHLEREDDYDEELSMPILLSRYSFSNGSQKRFRYLDLFLLNEGIVKAVGLTFDIDTLDYWFNGERVSMHYLNGSDQFFYLRKDVVDMILATYNGMVRCHLYERRMVFGELSETIPEVKQRFIQHEKDIFYHAK